MLVTLSEGFQLRSVILDDAEAVATLFNISGKAESPVPEEYTPDYSTGEIHSEWQEIDLTQDAWVIVAPDNTIIGFSSVQQIYTNSERTMARVDMHHRSTIYPEYTGRGFGTILVQTAEARARQIITTLAPELNPVEMRTWIAHQNEKAKELLLNEGFAPTGNSIWVMNITMQEAPNAPTRPEGILLRTFIPGQDDTIVKNVIDEAFGRPIRNWGQIYTNNEDFDPTTWFLAFAGDDLVGALLGSALAEMGYVDAIGVKASWRKHGLGMALLQHSLEDFYRRGLHKVELSVDVDNESGASRLYARAGMRVADQADGYHKQLHRN